MDNAFGQIIGSKRLLSLLGLSFIFAWVYAPMMLGEDFYLFYHLGLGCTLVVLSITARRRTLGTRPVSVLSVVSACFMGFAPIALFAQEAAGGVLVVAGGFLSGAANAWMLSHWFSLYCRFSTELSVSYTLLSFALSAAMRFALVPLSDVSSLAELGVLCAMPFLSLPISARCAKIDAGAFALRKSYDEHAAGDAPSSTGSVGFFCEIAVYGLVFGLMRNGIFEWSSGAASLYVGHLLRVLLPLLVLAWLVVPQDDERGGRALRGAVLTCALLIIAGIFFGGSHGVFISSITLVMRNFVTILLYLMLYYTVRDRAVSPVVVFGTGRGVYELALCVGLLLFRFTGISTIIAQASYTMLYFVLACVALLLLNSFAGISAIVRRRPPEVVQGATSELGVEERFSQVAKRYQLTERESEVMRLLCYGRTKRYIAETLYLSEDTVRWHAKQLYRKLDVHSKQELIDLVGIEQRAE